MQEELGWSRTALTGAYSVGLLVSALTAPLAGRWLDRYGPRGLMTLGSALGSVLLLAWASVEDHGRSVLQADRHVAVSPVVREAGGRE